MDHPTLPPETAQLIRTLVLQGHGPAILRVVGEVANQVCGADPGTPGWSLALEAEGLRGVLTTQARNENVWAAVAAAGREG